MATTTPFYLFTAIRMNVTVKSRYTVKMRLGPANLESIKSLILPTGSKESASIAKGELIA